jgi:hypothetical protein
MVNKAEVKLSQVLIKHHTMKMYMGVEVYLHFFLTTTVDGDEWSASRLLGNVPWYASDRRLGGPQSQSGPSS